MTYWERLELLGDDTDSSQDCGCGPPGDFYDPRDYESGWERNDAEEAEGYWLTDRLHEDGGFVYFKDAFGPELAPVALSMRGTLLARLCFLPRSCRTCMGTRQ